MSRIGPGEVYGSFLCFSTDTRHLRATICLEIRVTRPTKPVSRFTVFALLYRVFTCPSIPEIFVNVEVAALPEQSVAFSAVATPELGSDHLLLACLLLYHSNTLPAEQDQSLGSRYVIIELRPHVKTKHIPWFSKANAFTSLSRS